MDNNLMIFLVSICLITLLLMYRMVKKKKILFKHALMWCFLDLILLICIFTLPYLRIISDFIGIEKISNMIFLFGFLVLLAICIGLTTNVAEHRLKIIKLSQEQGILENKLRGLEDEYYKKNNNK